MHNKAIPNLSYYTVSKYEYSKYSTCDFSNIPRPHFCMGLLLEGTAVFSREGKEDVYIQPGEIIFVPITSRYISKWEGSTNIAYISMHFAFEPLCGISEREHFELQKICLPDSERLKEVFSVALADYNGSQAEQLSALSAFYRVLGQVLPLLKQEDRQATDKRIESALQYIHLHSEQPVTVSQLADVSHMSESNFYVRFKKYTGLTPIEYKNQVNIGRATRLLQSEPGLSVEQISDMLGFASSAYFRRLFKKSTGKTPTDFKKSRIEI